MRHAKENTQSVPRTAITIKDRERERNSYKQPEIQLPEVCTYHLPTATRALVTIEFYKFPLLLQPYHRPTHSSMIPDSAGWTERCCNLSPLRLVIHGIPVSG